MDITNNTITGHYFNKHISKNPLVRILVRGYKKALSSLVVSIEFNSLLEIGSGEGYIISYINQVTNPKVIVASDLDWKLLNENKAKVEVTHKLVCRGEALPFDKKSFDLIVLCEVLEHIINPSLVMEEVRRVGKKWFLASVPHEPWWRILNMMRFKYLGSLGNTPGHVQHWTLQGFVDFTSKYVLIERVSTAFPWIFVVGRLL
ncbi:class I SAM-dependent methyltransferase [Thermanaerothrix sp.]|uniref:class I SAM-dependent methyltransferase n=1 Tax=Thermanaerothrix sp. TaxID=2972675 RepID=UPI002ADE594A|nr:class I SAM-dependent methyltransferase [Thermanaerothrix sp.]